MYIYQEGKVYILKDNKHLVGVEIYPDKGVIKIEGTETVLHTGYEVTTIPELMCRFQITVDNPYIFPREVIKQNDTITEIKRTPRKYNKK